jgi:hypothetical protein
MPGRAAYRVGVMAVLKVNGTFVLAYSYPEKKYETTN